jgi:hypothetical protein
MNIYSQKVIDAFFQPFYDERIKLMYQLGKDQKGRLDLSLLLFWFSVIDFYGGIYHIGKHKKEKYRDGRLKLSYHASFKEYIEVFFPPPNNQVGQFIYKIFRSGIVHQISPKKGEIIWEPLEPRLIWVKLDLDNPMDSANKVAVMNIYQLHEMTYKSYNDFKNRITNDLEILLCEKIFNELLKYPDGLEDGITLDNEYKELLDRGIFI